MQLVGLGDHLVHVGMPALEIGGAFFLGTLLVPGFAAPVVTFAETVDVLMPARRVTDRDLIKQHVQRIVSGNTTNLFDGLYAGAAQIASVPDPLVLLAAQGYR